MTEVYVGFDNGLKGGAMSLTAAGGFIAKCRTDTYTGGWGNQIDPTTYLRFLTDILGENGSHPFAQAFVLVEEPLMIVRGAARPGMKARNTDPKAIQSTGVSFGKIMATVELGMHTGVLKNVRLQSIPPIEWQKHFWKKGGDTKPKSIKAATELFPHVDFKISDKGKGPHDGFTDAILITEYARRHRF